MGIGVKYQVFPSDPETVISSLGKPALLEALRSMMLVRHFETRAEAAYLQGKIGGFFHSYTGQEAIQTAATLAIGQNNWWTTSYRCHALALLLRVNPDELMAELFGKVTGNAKGRGGSMHFFSERLLGGFGIVGGQIPIATGAAFTIKYQKKKEVSVCFLGEGAVAQGAFHESLNIAALWNLPCIYVIENNKWGMGTGAARAISVAPIAEKKAEGYGMKGYTLDGMDFFNCYSGFKHIYEEVIATSRPVLVEAVTERFKGHSISDPGLYRSKEHLTACMERDPLFIMQKTLASFGLSSDEIFQKMDQEEKERILASLKFAEESPLPDPIVLGEDVFAK